MAIRPAGTDYDFSHDVGRIVPELNFPDDLLGGPPSKISDAVKNAVTESVQAGEQSVAWSGQRPAGEWGESFRVGDVTVRLPEGFNDRTPDRVLLERTPPRAPGNFGMTVHQYAVLDVSSSLGG